MKATYQWALGVAAVSVLAMGCGGDDNEGAEKKQIERVEVADSDFKPTELEATIDDLVEALTETEADSFEMTVVTKPFGGYWEPVKVGANRAMAELELTGQVEAPTDEDDPDVTTEAQIEIVKNRREEGYGGLGIAPMRESLAEEMDAFVAAGAPVVTIDSDLPESDRHLYIGTNNGEAGRSAGETLLNLLTEDSGTVIILGYPDEDWPDGYARSMGASEVLEAAGYDVIVHRVGWSEDEVATDMEVLPGMVESADPPVVGMLGMFSNAYRCAEIVEGLGYEPGEVKIAAFDFEPDTLSYMESGYIQATTVRRQYYMGYLVPYAIYSIRVLGLDATVDLLQDQMIDDERLDTGVDVVEADQVDEYNDFLDTLGIGG